MSVRSSSQGICQADEVPLVVGQAEPQQIICPVEATAPDVLLCELLMSCCGIVMSDQSEQRGSSDDGVSGGLQDRIKSLGIRCEPLSRGIGPAVVAQGSGADRQRLAGHGPWSESATDDFNDSRRADRRTKPNACEAIEFPERAQHDDRQIGGQPHGGFGRLQINEGLVDHKPAVSLLHESCRALDAVEGGHMPVGIVGIDDDRVTNVLRQAVESDAGDDLAPGAGPCARVLAVGGGHDRNGAGSGEMREPLDQRLRSGGGYEVGSGGNAIGDARGIDQRGLLGAGRKPVRGRCEQIDGNGPRRWIDARGQIEPGLQRSAITRDRLGQVAAMFHAGLLPLFSALRERALQPAVLVAVWLAVASSPAWAETPRIASINVCTDQLLMALADPAQIVGLSPYSRDVARSWAATEARKFPLLSGEAEDVLVLKPDVVVAGRFTKRATRELLKQKGLRVVEFDAARSIADVRSQILRMGDIVGHPERAKAEVERLDDALARARAMASRKAYSVLAVSRRGWVSGGDSLISALLAEVGLANAAGKLGLRSGGFASLEAIVSLKPDLILLSDSGDFAEDQGRAFLLHPALERLYPPEKRIVIPERLTVCGGPMLADALDRLTAELARIGR